MSSPPSTHGSPSLEDNAKRKREEKDSVGKAHDPSNPEPEVDTVPPKKMQVMRWITVEELAGWLGVASPSAKPEDDKVTKAEVKQIRKNLKTMPLEDARQDIDVDPVEEAEDMDAESDVTSTVDSPRPDSSKPDTETSTANQTPNIESAAEDDRSSRDTGSAANASPAQSTPASSSPTQATPTPAFKEPSPKEEEDKKTSTSSGFGNTSSVSPFANVKPNTNIFGSGSSTLTGMDSSSNASPFATMANQSSSFLSSSKPSGFGNTSFASPFATAASSTSIFGSTSSPASSSVSSDSKSALSSSVFGNTPSSSSSPFVTATPSASGTVFGVRSTIGSSTTSSPLPAATTTFGASSTTASKPFGTFGSLSKDSTGSFLDESTQGSGNFDALLTQETEDANPEDEETNTQDYTSSQFANAEQIDVVTGEEDEMTLFQTKGRLFADAEKSQSWKERGKGTFKVNVNRENTKQARLVMRTDGALRLILNIAVFPQMVPLITGEKYVRFVGIEDKKPIAFLLKVKDAETAQYTVTSIERAQARQKNGRETGVVLKDTDE
ncbi:hypothetical protein BGZ73_005101 [Actinomortierella ambigua]|nr:hypothetical protein BGZ73_005101 [Actinomortierella ambigua]